jgi:hypothetical protein
MGEMAELRFRHVVVFFGFGHIQIMHLYRELLQATRQRNPNVFAAWGCFLEGGLRFQPMHHSHYSTETQLRVFAFFASPFRFRPCSE